MVFGNTGYLGKKRDENPVATRECIKKSARDIIFCTEDVGWPDGIKDAFGVSSVYTRQGGGAIVRYDDKRATQYHVIFPKASFKRLANYFKDTLGPPSETPDIWTHLLGEPKRFNRTFRWRVPEDNGNGHMMVEIREIDDLRWSSPPDTQHGVVRLYTDGAKPVFQLLSVTDLMLIQIRKGIYQKDALLTEPPKE